MLWRDWLPLLAFAILLSANIALIGLAMRAMPHMATLEVRILSLEARSLAVPLATPGVLRGEFGAENAK